jgi:hypothetical protein
MRCLGFRRGPRGRKHAVAMSPMMTQWRNCRNHPMDLPDPVGNRRVVICLVLVEAQPVRAVIGVLAPAAAGEATFFPDTAADRTDFQ